MTNWVNDFLASSELSRFPYHPISNGIIFPQQHGQRTAVLQIQPVHYYDSGSFKPIDTALCAHRSGGLGTPGLAPTILPAGEVRFPGNYRHRTRGAGIYTPATDHYNQLVSFDHGAVSGNKLIRNQGIYAHEIILSEKRLKEQLIVQERPGNLEAGWFVIETEIPDKHFPIRNFKPGLEYNNVVFDGGAAWDADEDFTEVSQFVVERPGEMCALYSGVPVEWLEKAAFPVTIDPSYTSRPGISGKDTYLSESNPSSNYGSLYKMHFGSNGSLPGQDHAALMQFNLTSLQDCTVDSASLMVTKQGDTASSNLNVTLQRILVNWMEIETTWNNRITSAGWNSPGCLSTIDRENAALGSITFTPSDPDMVGKTIPLDAGKVQEWINGTLSNKGFRFGYDGDVNANTYYAIYSSDETTNSYRPTLEIEYTVLGKNFSVPAMCIG